MIVSYFRTLLMNLPQVYSEISDRIYPLSLPKPPATLILPCIVLSEPTHVETGAKTHESTVSFQVWGATTNNEYGYDMVKRISKTIRDSINSHSGTDSLYSIQNVAHKGDSEQIADDLSVFAVTADFDVIWEEV